MKVKILKLDEKVNLPCYQHKHDSCMDLTNSGEAVLLEPFARMLIHTGLKMELPEGYELQIRPRSGLALKKGITVLNTPGTIDSNYRGEVCVILYNASDKPVMIEEGERIAQAALCNVENIEWQEVEELNSTTRNEGGFGSTGKK
ncbi:MAG: dUTP diphosphatase [Elusimicrobiota bacterium]